MVWPSDTATARVYACEVGPGVPALSHPVRRPQRRVCAARNTVVGATKAKPPVYATFPAALLYARVEGRCIMGRGANWSRLDSRKRMRRQGIEDINGAMPVVAEPPKKAPS